jgi:hypothetical protein
VSRKPIANPLLDNDGYIDPVNLINPYAYAAAGGSFDPLSITGCVLWLKADGDVYNTGTTQATDGQDVATWVDASGSGNDATGYGAVKPKFETNELNGKPVVATNGSHAYLKGSISLTGTTLTAFIVTTTGSAGSSFTHLLDLANASGGQYASTDACSAFVTIGAQTLSTARNSNPPFPPHSVTDGVHFVGTTQYTGSNAEVRLNGGTAKTASSSGSFAITQYSISADPSGSSLGGPCEFAEILVYDSALGTTDREAVEDYLGDKYAITITH